MRMCTCAGARMHGRACTGAHARAHQRGARAAAFLRARRGKRAGSSRMRRGCSKRARRGACGCASQRAGAPAPRIRSARGVRQHGARQAAGWAPRRTAVRPHGPTSAALSASTVSERDAAAGPRRECRPRRRPARHAAPTRRASAGPAFASSPRPPPATNRAPCPHRRGRSQFGNDIWFVDQCGPRTADIGNDVTSFPVRFWRVPW